MKEQNQPEAGAGQAKFPGKVAVVTGASRGIGRSVALELARAGYDLLIHYRNSQAEAEALALEIEALHRHIVLVQGDVSSFADAKCLADAAFYHWEEVRVLVNNAGIIRDSPLAFMSESDWAEVIATNLTGMFNVTRAFIYRLLRQHHGSIINVSSVAGLVGNCGQTNYCASKAGIIGFSRALAKEVASHGLTVNCVAPGYIETAMVDGIPAAKRKAATERIPMKRFGGAGEVAKLVTFLASEDAAYITGQVYCVDGGLAA